MMKKHLTLIGALFILLSQTACMDNTNAVEEHGQLAVDKGETISDRSLREAVINYYDAESSGDWQMTYGLRPAEFRKLVPFETYKSAMEKGMAGWQLKKIEVINSTSRNTVVIVTIRFHEEYDRTVAESFFGGKVSEGLSRRTEDTIWKKVDERWLCVDAGQRGHLPINAKMISD